MDPEPETALRFFADSMLGRLAKRLRLAGIDTAYERRIADTDILRLAQAQRRTVLTRDRRLLDRKIARAGYYLHSDRIEAQWRELGEAFPALAEALPFTLCAECNTSLEELDRVEAEQLVPAYVYATQERFRHCRTCGRVYWRGTHHARIAEALRQKGL